MNADKVRAMLDYYSIYPISDEEFYPSFNNILKINEDSFVIKCAGVVFWFNSEYKVVNTCYNWRPVVEGREDERIIKQMKIRSII